MDSDPRSNGSNGGHGRGGPVACRHADGPLYDRLRLAVVVAEEDGEATVPFDRQGYASLTGLLGRAGHNWPAICCGDPDLTRFLRFARRPLRFTWDQASLLAFINH